VNDAPLPDFSDEQMKAMLGTSVPYVILSTGPNYGDPGAGQIIWEHGRRNFQLRKAGVLAVVLPVPDDSPILSVGVFTTSLAETEQIMIRPWRPAY
jgi:hypothetical protein